MGPEGVGGREGGAEVKAGPTGPAPLRGGWGRGGLPTPSGTHPRLGVQWGRGDPGGDGEGHRGTEGNAASVFPVHLAPRPNHLPSEPPSCRAEPKPRPYTPPRAPPLHSETPSNALGLNPTHSPSPRALQPNSRTPHSAGPPSYMLPLPFCTGPKQRPTPCLNVAPPPT